ncbi:MAG: hypothetical protein COB85_05430 [Bacteroidetes bacterium]|nr:MAG: hypothetical protein COB85_05430 [Bacteroidota bacterium]
MNNCTVLHQVKKFSSNFIFSGNSAPIANGVLVTDDHGRVLDLLENDDGLEDVLHIDGFLCPGFVNSHCHLELSHLFGKLPKKQGLVNFLKPIIEIRGASEETVQSAMIEADNAMLREGIVAVGDICNEPASFNVKAKSDIRYYNFVEVIGTDPAGAEERYNIGEKIYEQSSKFGLPCSIVPHAPYTISPELLARIDSLSANRDLPVCFHNQESDDERELFENRSGAFVDFYMERGLDIGFFNPNSKSSLSWMADNLSSSPRPMAVHNTYTTTNDIEMALEHNPNMYWCFCPNANLYIENRTPDFHLFTDFDDRITIGTDSLASNTQLSILDEIKTIARIDSSINLGTLIKWATINGAKYLGMSDDLGSFEVGSKPGVNLISSLSGGTGQLTQESKVKKLA